MKRRIADGIIEAPKPPQSTPQIEPAGEYWTRMAVGTDDDKLKARYERLAKHFAELNPKIDETVPPQIEPEPESEPSPKPLQFPTTIKTFSELNQAILLNKNADLHRAAALWYVLRSPNGSGKIAKEDALQVATSWTGRSRSAAYGWLNSGEGIFWNSGKDGQLYLMGKNAVIDRFLGEDIAPGKAIYIPITKLLSGRLLTVRGSLSATWIKRAQGVNKARKTRRVTSQGIPERTQYNYDKAAKVIVRKNSTYVPELGKSRQGSNLYLLPKGFEPERISTPKISEFKGYRATENAAANLANGDKANGAKVYFTQAVQANKVAAKRKAEGDNTPVIYTFPMTDPTKPNLRPRFQSAIVVSGEAEWLTSSATN